VLWRVWARRETAAGFLVGKSEENRRLGRTAMKK